MTAAALETAIAELEQLKGQQERHAANEIASAGSRETYDKWTIERDRLAIEVKRSADFVETLNKRIEDDEVTMRRVALYARREAQVRANAALAKRIRADGEKAMKILLPLIQAVAEAEKVDREINRVLPDEDRIVPADIIARGHRKLREEISSREVELWVFEDSGQIVGDQRSVAEQPDGRGVRNSAARASYEDNQFRSNVKSFFVRRKFREIEYRPGEDTRFEPLLAAVRLPLFSRRGVAWDLSQTKGGVEAALSRLEAPVDETPVLTELLPLEPLPKKLLPGHRA